MSPRVHRLERSQCIPGRRDEVFAFFAGASNLEAITPPFLHFRILSPLPIEMRPGARIDYALSLGGGVEVFRRLYAAVGFGPLAALTRLPGVAQLLDLGYRWFAKNRLRLTGRCADGACELHLRPTRV